jgi:hypothetical protein
MNQEFRQDFIIGSLVFHKFVPHIHDYHIRVIFHEFFCNFIQFRQKLEALVIDEIVKQENTLILHVSWRSS